MPFAHQIKCDWCSPMGVFCCSTPVTKEDTVHHLPIVSWQPDQVPTDDLERLLQLLFAFTQTDGERA